MSQPFSTAELDAAADVFLQNSLAASAFLKRAASQLPASSHPQRNQGRPENHEPAMSLILKAGLLNCPFGRSELRFEREFLDPPLQRQISETVFTILRVTVYLFETEGRDILSEISAQFLAQAQRQALLTASSPGSLAPKRPSL